MSDGGGSTFSSGGGIDDEDLDEYIDFLIAHADGKVPESENPLFKKKKKPSVLDEQEPQVVLASSTTTTTTARFQESSIPAYVTPAPVAEEEEETKTTDTTTSKVSLESTSTSNDAVVSDEVSMTEDTRIRKNVTDVEEIVEMQEKRGSESDFVPIVDDVEDDTQLDDMIETLVATVEDDEEEEILIKQEHKDEEEEEIPKEQTELVAVLDVEDVNQSDEMVDTFVVTVEDEDIQEKESSITSSAAQQEAGQDAQPALDFFLGPSAVEGVPSLLSEAASTDDETPEQAVENDVSRKVKTIFKHSVWTVKSKSEDVWSRLAGYLETKKESRLVEESGVSEPMEKMDITEGEALDNPEAASEGGGGRERKTEAAPVLAEKPDISAKVKTYYKKSVWAVKSKSVHAWGTFAKYLETKRKKPAEASVEEPRPRKERDYSKIYEKYYDSPRKAEGTPSASAMDQPDVEKHEGFASDMFTQEKIMNVLWFYPTDGATKILWSYPKDGAAKILWSYPKDGALVTWGTLNNMVHKARTKPASMPVDIEEDVSPDEEESASEEIEEYREVIVSIDTISEAEISHRADEEEEGPIKDEDFAAVEVDGEELEGESLSTKSVDVEEDFSLDEEESSSDETEEYGEAIVSIGTLSEDEISDDMEVGEEEEEETEERSLEGSADEEEILFAGSADIVAKDEIDLAVDENSSEEEDKEISLHSEVEEELSIEEEYGYDYSEDDLDGRLERDVVSNAVTEDAGLEEEGGESTMDDNGEAASDGDVIRAAVSGSSVGVSDTEDGSMEDLQEGGIELAIPLSFDSGDSDVLVEELSDTEIVEAFDSVIEPVGEDYESSNVTPKEQAASRRLEAESLNFFYRFLLARGFDRLLTTIILVAEWCRLYLRPIAEIPEWVVNKESKPLLSHDRFSFMKTRGGGLPEDETVSEGSEEGTVVRAFFA